MTSLKNDYLGEKRAGPRYPHCLPIRFTTLGDFQSLPNNEEKHAETIDLNNEGMKIKTKGKHFKEGTMINVRISFPGFKIALPVLAEVKWTKEKKDECLAGLRFL